jgi:hypothetical protein
LTASSGTLAKKSGCIAGLLCEIDSACMGKILVTRNYELGIVGIKNGDVNLINQFDCSRIK